MTCSDTANVSVPWRCTPETRLVRHDMSTASRSWFIITGAWRICNANKHSTGADNVDVSESG
jgi:hypothetical protein